MHRDVLEYSNTAGNGVANVVFNYAGLNPEVVAEARAAAARIRRLGAQLNETVVAVGRELAAIKGRLGHGHFGDWIKAEFGMSADTAERYMRVAAALDGKIRTVRNLRPTTLYALTAKATPEAVRDEIVTRIEAGEEISDGEVCRTVRRAVSEAQQSTRRSSSSATPKIAEPAAQARARAIIGFSSLLHSKLAETLDDLPRILNDERHRIVELPLQKRVGLARRYLAALGVTLVDLQQIGEAS